ncbi:hypothetical protein HMPREF1155_1479 [Slackia sp. CM382]|nr:hypothetical protein HMPREF1155_1479 [Slackia sp. CM382]
MVLCEMGRKPCHLLENILIPLAGRDFEYRAEEGRDDGQYPPNHLFIGHGVRFEPLASDQYFGMGVYYRRSKFLFPAIVAGGGEEVA